MADARIPAIAVATIVTRIAVGTIVSLRGVAVAIVVPAVTAVSDQLILVLVVVLHFYVVVCTSVRLIKLPMKLLMLVPG